jgi:kynurenine formamidase
MGNRKTMSNPILLTAALLVTLHNLVVAEIPRADVADLSVLVAPEMPCVWPVGMTPFAAIRTQTVGPAAEQREMLVIDEHTGTQWDAPAHFVPPPDSGLPGAGPNGSMTGEKVPVWQFCGEACVIDVTAHRDAAAAGASFLIRPEMVQDWERKHRRLKFGDVVLFRSDYSDHYYQPFPRGERFVASALRKNSPAWPAPTPQTMSYLGDRGVMTLGLDGASMGPLPDLAAATHQAGGKRGMIWIECGTNFGALPPTGAFFAMLPAKHAGGSGSECRAIAITEPALAATLIARARRKQVVDLSVTLHEDYPVTWPGRQPGEEGSRYVAKTLNAFNLSRGPFFALTHMLDSRVGTHVVAPSAVLPAKDFDRSTYTADVAESLHAFEAKFGPLGEDGTTIDRVPLGSMMGRAHVIDVRDLVGSTKSTDWPASPIITLEHIQRHEASVRPVERGEVVLFWSGHSDSHFQPLPAAPALDPLFAAPLAGQSEGWPAAAPEVIAYLADKGVSCVGTDGPTLGGVDLEHSRAVHWLAATRGVLAVEFLTRLSAIADKEAFFLFAPIKVRGIRSGYGRAMALFQ